MIERLLIVLLVGASTIAHAQPAQPQPQPQPQPQQPTARTAAQLIDEGRRLYADDADFASALEAFQASYAMAPSWQALNGIALSQRQLGRHVAAFKALKKLLAEHAAALSASQQANATKLLTELDGKIGRISIVVEGDAPEEVRTTLDGAAIEPADRAGPHLVMPGNHAVVATRDGYQPFASQVTIAPGASETVTVVLEPEKEKIIVQVEEARLVRPMPAWLPWSTMAGGLALAGAGTLFALSAASDYDDFDASVKASAGEFPSQTMVDEAAKKRGDTKAGIALGLYITAGAAAAAGVTLLVLNQPRREKPKTAIIVTPKSISVAYRF